MCTECPLMFLIEEAVNAPHLVGSIWKKTILKVCHATRPVLLLRDVRCRFCKTDAVSYWRVGIGNGFLPPNVHP